MWLMPELGFLKALGKKIFAWQHIKSKSSQKINPLTKNCADETHTIKSRKRLFEINYYCFLEMLLTVFGSELKTSKALR